MNTITINLPSRIKATPELIKRINLAAKPDIAEYHAILLCEREFDQSFKVASYNKKGFDVVSEDGTIVVEVKQTSCKEKLFTRLSVGSVMPKKHLCTHMMVFDYYNDINRVSIIPHDEFFNSVIHAKDKAGMWRWDINYGKGKRAIMVENTQLFLKYEKQI